MLLHLEVVEIPQVVLQPLECLDKTLDLDVVEQAHEELQQVAQLLALDAQLVQGIAGRVRLDGLSHAPYAPIGTPDPLRRDLDHRTRRVLGVRVSAQRHGE